MLLGAGRPGLFLLCPGVRDAASYHFVLGGKPTGK